MGSSALLKCGPSVFLIRRIRGAWLETSTLRQRRGRDSYIMWQYIVTWSCDTVMWLLCWAGPPTGLTHHRADSPTSSGWGCPPRRHVHDSRRPSRLRPARPKNYVWNLSGNLGRREPLDPYRNNLFVKMTQCPANMDQRENVCLRVLKLTISGHRKPPCQNSKSSLDGGKKASGPLTPCPVMATEISAQCSFCPGSNTVQTEQQIQTDWESWMDATLNSGLCRPTDKLM